MKGLEKDIAELKREIKANIFDSHHVTLTLTLTRRRICQMEDVLLMFEQVVPPQGRDDAVLAKEKEVMDLKREVTILKRRYQPSNK